MKISPQGSAGRTTGATIELKRDLGLWGAAAIVVGTVIGSGIFIVPQTMVQLVGSPQMVFVVWAVGGLLSLAGALSYAELAAAMPEAGGEYVYLTEGYGPLWGFIYGWTQMWVAKSGSIAILATGFFYYLANFLPGLERVFFTVPLPLGAHGAPLDIRYGQLFGMALIFSLGVLNYFGVKIGGGVQVTVTIIKVALILLIVVIGLGWGHPTDAPRAAALAPLTVLGFFGALVKSLWAYDGWNNVSMVSSEIRKPQRNLPLSLIWGTVGVIVIYILANIAYFYVLSPAEVAGSNRVAATMMRHVLGQAGANLVSVAAMISMFAALNGSILTGARVPYAQARGGYFFAPLARVNASHHTPGVAIMGLSAWGMIIVLSGNYDQLVDLVIFASWILYGMTCAAVLVLRRKRPDLERPYRTLGYPLVPVLFVIAAAAIAISALYNSPRESGMGIAAILIGLPFYFHWKKRHAAI
jgi:APA family basic amino acid/polyamine antiporter